MRLSKAVNTSCSASPTAASPQTTSARGLALGGPAPHDSSSGAAHSGKRSYADTNWIRCRRATESSV